MKKIIKSHDKLSVVEYALAFIVLFYAALVFCLPVTFSEKISYPWWASTISLGNIVLHEAFFFVWLVVYGFRFVLRRLLNAALPTRQAAICLIVLAIWCGLISLSTPLPLQDLARSFRLLLNAGMLIAVVRWTRQKPDFPLFVLLAGFVTGTVINLVFSFENPLIVNETMRLSGQNTAGVGMAIAIHLSAWLFIHSKNRILQLFSIVTALICSFGCGISFSRIGWIIGALGVGAWFYVLVFAKPSDRTARVRMKRKRRVWLPLLLLTFGLAFCLPVVQENFAWIQSLIQQKDWVKSESNDNRSTYFIGVTEIVAKHPLGVGYSGFYDAITATDAYRTVGAAEETSLDANPHSGFLYYISAGGIIGGLLATTLFILLLRSLRLGLLSAFGTSGGVLFALVAVPFLLIGLTVPYIYNSIIVIVPAAIAAGWGCLSPVSERAALKSVTVASVAPH